MALQIKDIELAWHSLEHYADASGWRSITITTIGPCTLLAGLRFPEKSEALLVSFSPSIIPATEQFPEGHGFTVSRIDPNNGELTWLALTRSTQGNIELFAPMVADVATAMDTEANLDEKRLLRIFLGRIRAWQEFMRKGARSLSTESEIGLVGELTLLRQIIDAGVPPVESIESWIGPLNGAQDFELGTGCMEVKTTLSATGFPAKIGSLEQLDDSVRQPLFLVGIRLHQTNSGQSLPELVAEMRDVVAGEVDGAHLLSERLIAAGYLDIHSNHYLRRFVLTDTRIIRVKDGFPRLTFSSVPLGVTKATYEIDLDKVVSPYVPITNALKELRAI